MAALPNNQAATIELYRQHAYNFITDTRAEYSVNSTTQAVTTQFTVTTEAKRVWRRPLPPPPHRPLSPPMAQLGRQPDRHRPDLYHRSW